MQSGQLALLARERWVLGEVGAPSGIEFEESCIKGYKQARELLQEMCSQGKAGVSFTKVVNDLWKAKNDILVPDRAAILELSFATQTIDLLDGAVREHVMKLMPSDGYHPNLAVVRAQLQALFDGAMVQKSGKSGQGTVQTAMNIISKLE
eukprot:2223884-Lingulodinium_polyedra.AAC.1